MSQARQSWDPQSYQQNAAFVAKLGEPLLDLLEPAPGERILDLGCGDGALTVKLAEAGAEVLGIDFSEEQVAGARALGLDAEVGSGEELAFASEFDAIFSNAALHWMLRPDRVIDGVWRALKPGGRFVAEMGGAGNVQTIREALIAALERRGYDGEDAVPWYFPSPEEYRGKLESKGFAVPYIELIPRPTPLPGDLSGWLSTFGESFLSRLPERERPAMVEEVTAELKDKLSDGAGNWTADYVRLRFRAEKPGA